MEQEYLQTHKRLTSFSLFVSLKKDVSLKWKDVLVSI